MYPRPRFASEYGFQSYPSQPAWRSVLPANTTDALRLMDHRQHFPYGDAPILLLIQRHLPLPSRSLATYADALVYLSQISQAMVTRTETEVYRCARADPAARTMGALYWQLNDVWVAPSWSGIEYGGNYKILHHWAHAFLAPVAVVAHLNADGALNVFVVRDTLGDLVTYTVTVQAFYWSTLAVPPQPEHRFACPMTPNSAKLVSTMAIERVLVAPMSAANSFVRVQLHDAANRTVSTSFVFPGRLKAAQGMRTDVGLEVRLSGYQCRSNRSEVDVRLHVRYPALFVWLTVELAAIRSYRFAENGFVQLEADRTVRLSYANAGCALAELRASDVRVQTVNEYMEG